MQVLSTILDVALVGCAGAAMFFISPVNKPYAFTGCAIFATYGLYNFVANVFEDSKNEKVQQALDGIMSLVPLPLVNIELYLPSETNNIGLGHSLYMVPYVLELCFEISKIGTGGTQEEAPPPAEGEQKSDDSQDNAWVLKILTQAASIWSLVYLAVNDGNNLYLGMSAAAFVYIFCPYFVEKQFEGHGENVKLLGASAFCLLALKTCQKQG